MKTVQYTLTETFEANGRSWKTDVETLNLMREFREAGNRKMVSVVFHLAADFGRVKAAQ